MMQDEIKSADPVSASPDEYVTVGRMSVLPIPWWRSGVFDPESSSIFSRQLLSLILVLAWIGAWAFSNVEMANAIGPVAIGAVGYWFGKSGAKP
jgi:hypothetical protein